MAKLRNLNINNEALAGVNADEAAEISIVITSTEPDSVTKLSTLNAAVTAEGSKSLSYAWYKNDALMDDKTSASIEVTVNKEEASYKCTVTATYDGDSTKSQDSNVLTLKLTETPTPSESTEPMIGSRKLSEHLRMRLLGYI